MFDTSIAILSAIEINIEAPIIFIFYIIWWNWIAYHRELCNDACKRYCAND